MLTIFYWILHNLHEHFFSLQIILLFFFLLQLFLMALTINKEEKKNPLLYKKVWQKCGERRSVCGEDQPTSLNFEVSVIQKEIIVKQNNLNLLQKSNFNDELQTFPSHHFINSISNPKSCFLPSPQKSNIFAHTALFFSRSFDFSSLITHPHTQILNFLPKRPRIPLKTAQQPASQSTRLRPTSKNWFLNPQQFLKPSILMPMTGSSHWSSSIGLKPSAGFNTQLTHLIGLSIFSVRFSSSILPGILLKECGEMDVCLITRLSG